MSEIDWNVELRKISRQFDGLPAEPPRRQTRTQIRLQKIQEVAAKHRFYERLSVIGLWVRLSLIGVLTIALFWWPYGRSCGFPLAAFLVSNAMVIAGALSLTPRTWRERMVWPFAGSTILVAVAWTVIALYTLPRLGYSPGGAPSAGWSCVAKQ